MTFVVVQIVPENPDPEVADESPSKLAAIEVTTMLQPSEPSTGHLSSDPGVAQIKSTVLSKQVGSCPSLKLCTSASSCGYPSDFLHAEIPDAWSLFIASIVVGILCLIYGWIFIPLRWTPVRLLKKWFGSSHRGERKTGYAPKPTLN